MTARIIPIAEARYAATPALVPTQPVAPNGRLVDSLDRPLHDLRVSVTDRCNFRCGYCMPRSVFGTDYPYLPQTSLLSFEEIERLVRLFAAHGVRKVRLTGGEPLLRKHLEVLIERLAAIVAVDGRPLEIAMTTNASLLARRARALRDAGLTRVTVSLDAIDDAVFRQMNDSDFPVADVLEGLDAARSAGFESTKINMVVRRGINDSQILPMARHFKGSGHILRFIEFMDVGASNHWQRTEVVPSAEVVRLISADDPLIPLNANYVGEVAERWRYVDGGGEIGVISSVTQPFCGDCSRARLSTEGRLYTCLFTDHGHDLRSLVRGGASDLEVAGAIGRIWNRRDDRYSQLRGSVPQAEKIEMSYIGG